MLMLMRMLKVNSNIDEPTPEANKKVLEPLPAHIDMNDLTAIKLPKKKGVKKKNVDGSQVGDGEQGT